MSVVGPFYLCPCRYMYCGDGALSPKFTSELSSGDVLALRNPPPSTRCGGAFSGARAVQQSAGEGHSARGTTVPDRDPRQSRLWGDAQ